MNSAAFKELLHVIKYALDTFFWFEVGNNQECQQPWAIVCLSDGNNEGDPVSRRSVSGFILYVFHVAVSW